MPSLQVDATGSTDMKIAGKMNKEDDTIFLKVQIADNDGSVRNIYFPFDIVSDTAIDVATEMVKELEITDGHPLEIAEMIEKEISALVPHWQEWDTQQNTQAHSFSFQDDDVNDDEDHIHDRLHGDQRDLAYDWLQDDLNCSVMMKQPCKVPTTPENTPT
ncbi:hypothetical protein IFM89_033525 [Coptis chinensis]|uniref:non-specific serine/threonine protein kinase n=1 Tax=Coptis chinensis TaxID=261450 RepID=A0A835H8Y4_9MAGN|nr:hypothetical protein IFM89_033525 [Coptis chinensis]